MTIHQFSALIEYLPDAVILTDLRGMITDANARTCMLFGYGQHELIGIPVEGLVPEREREAHRNHRSFYYKNPTVRPMGGSLALAGQRRDGSEFPAEISLSPIEVPGGTLIISVIRDVTERMKLEEAMRESEERYRSLVELSPEAIVVHAAGTIVYANEATVRLLLAPSREAIIGRSLLDFVPPEYIDEVKMRMQSPPPETQKRKPMLITSHRSDGQEFSLEAIASRITFKGQPAAQVILRDITEQTRAYQELGASRQQLRNLSTHLQSAREAERTSIAREIHDELGGALTALKFDLASFEDVLPGEVQEDLRQAIREKAEAMSALIDGTVQTMRRIITELRPVLLDSLGLSAAIEWQAEDFQRRTGIACEVSLEGEETIQDRDRATAVYRIFQETLTNVARHAGATRVRVSLTIRNRKLSLSVSDNGRGVTEEELGRSKSFGILGMRERALIFGGEVLIVGSAGAGTTVSLSLPLRDAPEPEHAGAIP